MTHFITDLTDLKIAIGITVSFISLIGSYAIFDMISNRNKYTLSEEEKDEIWNRIVISLDELDKIEHENDKSKN